MKMSKRKIEIQEIICFLLICLANFTLGEDLYISTFTKIKKINIDSWNETTIVSKENSQFLGLAVDLRDAKIYYADIADDTLGIYRMNLNDSSTESRIIFYNQMTPVGLALDWVFKHLYWTDTQYRAVMVSNLDGSGRIILVTEGLRIPRGIAVDPDNLKLYVGDQDVNQILQCDLDGRNCQYLHFREEDLIWPNQITINYLDNNIYWTEGGIPRISSCDINGTNCRSNLCVSRYDMSLFGIAFTGADSYYLTSLFNRTIYNVNHTGIIEIYSEAEQSDNDLSSFVVSSNITIHQPKVSTQHPCVYKNHSCEGICLPSTGNVATCTCPSASMKLASANGSCEDPSEFLLYTSLESGDVGISNPDLGFIDTMIIRGIKPLGLTYDPVKQDIYFSDAARTTIYSYRLGGSRVRILLNSSHGIGHVEGLAIDLKQRRLYFTNTGYSDKGDFWTWGNIEMLDLQDVQKRRRILTNLNKPRGIFIDSENRMLYYTDWGETNPHVGRVRLDGYNRQTLYQAVNPNGLVIVGGRLYVTDSRNHSSQSPLVISSYLDGSNKLDINISEMGNIYSITNREHNLMITDLEGRTGVYSTSGVLQSNIKYTGYTNILFTIRSIDIQEDQGLCITNICSDICVTTSNYYYPTCLCSSYSFHHLQRDRQTCSRPSNSIVFADIDGIMMVPLDGSGDDHIYNIIPSSSECGDFHGLARDDNNIYFSSYYGQTIFRASLDGADVVEYYKTDHKLISLAIYRDTLYWTAIADIQSQQGGIFSTSISRPTIPPEEVVGGLNNPYGIAVYGRAVYWTDRDIGVIKSTLRWTQNSVTDSVKINTESFVKGISWSPTFAVIAITSDEGLMFGRRRSNNDCPDPATGTDYRGTMSTTVSGLTCQEWSSQTPHKHSYSNRSLEKNYCRNPIGKPHIPWCYTTDPQKRWEYCSIPICECRKTPTGTDYRGTISTTVSGLTCQEWSSQTPHKHSISQPSLLKNYCRNPMGKPHIPWCYTTDPHKRWEYCSIPFCGVAVEYTTSDTASSNVVQLDDSMVFSSSWENCTSNASLYKYDILHKVTYLLADNLVRPGQLIQVGKQLEKDRKTKPGTCPPTLSERNIDKCFSDFDCFGKKKCCQAAWYSKCVDPMPESVCKAGDFTLQRDVIEKIQCQICSCAGQYSWCNSEKCSPLPCPRESQVSFERDCCTSCISASNCPGKPKFIYLPSSVREILLPNGTRCMKINLINMDLTHIKAISCSGKSLEINLDTEELCWKKLPQVVKLIASDRQGSTVAKVKVKVKDTTPPIIESCPVEGIKVAKRSKDKTVPVTWQPIIVNDNIDVNNIRITETNGLANGHEFQEGETNVEYRIVDGDGNDAFCKFAVVIEFGMDYDCPIPPLLHNGHMACYKSKSRVTCEVFRCYDGYLMKEGTPTKYVCGSNGKWGPVDFPARFTTETCFKPVPSIFNMEFTIQLDCANANVLVEDISDCLENSGLSQHDDIRIIYDQNLTISHDKGFNVTGKVSGALEYVYDQANYQIDKDDMISRVKRVTDGVRDFFTNAVFESRCPALACGFISYDDTDDASESCPRGAIERIVKGKRACANCAPGSKFEYGKCQLCDPDSYQERAGQDSCIKCPAGTNSELGAFLYDQCRSSLINIANKDEVSLNTTIWTIVGVLTAVLLIAIIVVIIVRVVRAKKSATYKVPPPIAEGPSPSVVPDEALIPEDDVEYALLSEYQMSSPNEIAAAIGRRERRRLPSVGRGAETDPYARVSDSPDSHGGNNKIIGAIGQSMECNIRRKVIDDNILLDQADTDPYTTVDKLSDNQDANSLEGETNLKVPYDGKEDLQGARSRTYSSEKEPEVNPYESAMPTTPADDHDYKRLGGSDTRISIEDGANSGADNENCLTQSLNPYETALHPSEKNEHEYWNLKGQHQDATKDDELHGTSSIKDPEHSFVNKSQSVTDENIKRLSSSGSSSSGKLAGEKYQDSDGEDSCFD